MNWASLNELANDHKDSRFKHVRRDGHCHEAVMWYVHHISQVCSSYFPGMFIDYAFFKKQFKIFSCNVMKKLTWGFHFIFAQNSKEC